MEMKVASRRISAKTSYLRHLESKNEGKTNTSDDHRQTMNSILVEERQRSGRLNIEGHTRERDHLHRQPEKAKRQDSSSKDRNRVEHVHRNSSTSRTSDKNGAFVADRCQSHEHHSRREDGWPEEIESSARSEKKESMKRSNSNRSVLTPTGTHKPPLKPRRLRHNKSVCTKSTSSATYVSSDSSDGGEGDDDSIETPDIHIRVNDAKGHTSQSNSCDWSSASSLAPYESTDECSRFAMVPYQEKKKKKQRSRAVGKKASQIVPVNSDDDDVDPFFHLGVDEDFANAYNLSSSDTDSSDNERIVDLDEIIAETSARWKTAVTAIVTNTVTSASKGALVASNIHSSPSPASSVFPGPIGSSNQSALRQVHAPPSQQKAAMVSRKSSKDSVASGRDSVIEKQQAEIESLRAALIAQQQHSSNGSHNQYSKFNSDMLVLPETSEFVAPHTNFNFQAFSSKDAEEDITIDCAPVEHIEVNHDVSDPNSSHYWQDDLTVWSGFNTVTGGMDVVQSSQNSVANDTKAKTSRSKPLLNRRPDAASTTGASALDGVPIRVVEDMKVDLSSGMTGVIRKAVFSGTINAHTRRPQGQGCFKFLETGDIYQGEVHDGEMHGAGTYTFGRSNRKGSKPKGSHRPKALKGTFEHNVFIG